jgi:hypothetical protein
LVAHRSGAVKRAVLVAGGTGGVLADTDDDAGGSSSLGMGSSSSSGGGDAEVDSRAEAQAEAARPRRAFRAVCDPLALVACLEAIAFARHDLASHALQTHASSDRTPAEAAATPVPATAAPATAAARAAARAAAAGDLVVDGAPGVRLVVRRLFPSHAGPAAGATLVLVLRRDVPAAAYQPSIERAAAAVAFLLAAAHDSRLA